MPQNFGPGVRLRSRGEFTAVQQHGRRVAMPHLVLIGRANDLGRDRLGIIASRRLGGAVVRNRAKRRLRELFRLRASQGEARPAAGAFDLVAIPRRELIDAPFTVLQAEFLKAFTRVRAAR